MSNKYQTSRKAYKAEVEKISVSEVWKTLDSINNEVGREWECEGAID